MAVIRDLLVHVNDEVICRHAIELAALLDGEMGAVFAGASGTSAGAMNAVALALGLMEGGRNGARAALRRLWKDVARLAPWHQGMHSLLSPASQLTTRYPGPDEMWWQP